MKKYNPDELIGLASEIDDEIGELYHALTDVWPIISRLNSEAPKGYQTDIASVYKNLKRLLRRYGYF